MRSNSIPSSLKRKFRNRLSPYWRNVYDVGLYTGWRISDILSLTHRNCLPYNWVHIMQMKTGVDSWRRIPKSLKQRIGNYCGPRPDGYLFPSPRNWNAPVSRQAAHRAFKKAADLLELERVSPHSMRKTYAQEKHRAGASLKELQEALQHDRVETTLLYLINNYDELINEALRRSKEAG